MHLIMLNYKIRNKQITVEQLYEVFMQLHVSTPWGYHQAGFWNIFKGVYISYYGGKTSLLTNT